MEIYDKIRILRTSHQWTQEDIAEKLNMSVNGYSKIERGKSSINIEKLKQIAQVFNMDILELISSQQSSFPARDNLENYNIISSDAKLLYENEKLKLLLEIKEDLISQKDDEILVLKKLITVLESQAGK
ncbi:TPA: helix-turn-helix domain-containing protein [Neisseria subflava]|uniref:helix-turn-helix domain-containing protein n=1 Tax=Neisseria subflava TaxID=28449 RepID=UPI00066E8AD4